MAKDIVMPKMGYDMTEGKLLRWIKHERDTVSKGDPNANPPIPASVLVRLDDTDLRAQLTSAQARYDGQKAQIGVAEAETEFASGSAEGGSAEQSKSAVAAGVGVAETENILPVRPTVPGDPCFNGQVAQA